MDDDRLRPLQMPPDLNSEGNSTRPSVKTIAMVLVGAATGAAISLMLFRGESSGSSPPEADLGVVWALTATVGLVVLIGLALAAHEVGHLLGGWLSGFRFQLFALGPLMLTRAPDGLRARWHTHWSLYGGLALSLPTDLTDLAHREARMVAGGPVTSLLLGLTGIGAYLALGEAAGAPRGSVPFGWLLVNGAFFFGVGSLGIGLVTLIPTTTSGFYTDGARLWRLWRDHPATERDAAVFALTALLFAERPRDWNTDLVEQAIAVDDNTLFDVEGRRLAYFHAIDGGDFAVARNRLQGAIDRHAIYPSALLSNLTGEAAFFEGAVRGDAPAARRWLAASGTSAGLNESTQLRAQAAAAWAAGEAAGDMLDRARDALSSDMAPPLAAAQRDWLNVLARWSQGQSAPSP